MAAFQFYLSVMTNAEKRTFVEVSSQFSGCEQGTLLLTYEILFESFLFRNTCVKNY